MVELNKDPSFSVDLGLPEGKYTVTLEQGRKLYAVSLAVRSGGKEELAMRQFSPLRREPAVARGSGSRGAERAEQQDWSFEEWFAPPERPQAAVAPDEAQGAGTAVEPELIHVPVNFSVLPFLSTAGGGAARLHLLLQSADRLLLRHPGL